MWVWQSQAPPGTSKLTVVDGWAALANARLLFMATPAATEASRIPRRVSMTSSLVILGGSLSGDGAGGKGSAAGECKARPRLATLISKHLVTRRRRPSSFPVIGR